MSYQTTLDMYILTGLTCLFFGIMQDALSSRLQDDAFDVWSTAVLYGFWLLLHLGLCVYVFWRNSHRLHRMQLEATKERCTARLFEIFGTHTPQDTSSESFFQFIRDNTCKRTGRCLPPVP